MQETRICSSFPVYGMFHIVSGVVAGFFKKNQQNQPIGSFAILQCNVMPGFLGYFFDYRTTRSGQV